MKNSHTLLKVIAVVGALTFIVAIAIYMNLNKAASSGDVAALEQAILGNPVQAYGVNECAKPVVPGTSMTDSALRYYFTYHITETNFGGRWYTCAIANLLKGTMNRQSHASLMNMVNTMEANGCDVPATTDAPATYCGTQRPA